MRRHCAAGGYRLIHCREDLLDRQFIETLAAAVERESEHPLAQAVVHYAESHGIGRVGAEDFENVPGQGTIARVKGRRVAVGNTRLMEREKLALGY